MGKHRNPRRWSKRSPEEWCRMAREAGDGGMAVTQATAFLGIDFATFKRWEEQKPAFAEATRQIRENSARLMLSRTEKQLGKSEAQFMRALAHVRQKKAEERARIEKAMAEGRIWTPEQLAAKIQNLKELRAEARREERARQKKRAFPGGITVTTVEYVPTKK